MKFLKGMRRKGEERDEDSIWRKILVKDSGNM